MTAPFVPLEVWVKFSQSAHKAFWGSILNGKSSLTAVEALAPILQVYRQAELAAELKAKCYQLFLDSAEKNPARFFPMKPLDASMKGIV